MENQQLYNLNENQMQVLLTGKFGDGHFTTPKTQKSNSQYITNCVNKVYLEFKKSLLGKLVTHNIYSYINQGYKCATIYKFETVCHPSITYLRGLSVEKSLNLLNDLGIALWFYDDGSLHNSKLFYNLNTQSFSEEIQNDLFIPKLKQFGIKAKCTREVKKDGREFFYLRISKYEGAYEISELLRKFYVKCYDYKLWSSETSQQWRKVQENLKSTDKDISHKMLGALMKKVSL